MPALLVIGASATLAVGHLAPGHYWLAFALAGLQLIGALGFAIAGLPRRDFVIALRRSR